MPSRHVVVMGVSGAGKSTVAAALADRLGLPFAEGDEFHGPTSRAKMAAGVPLDDDDRWEWLAALRDWMTAHCGEGSVVACSALRRGHRDVLAGAAGDVLFVLLDVPADELRSRMAAREGHFMPASLLDSQLATLEPLADEEPGFTVPATGAPDLVVERVLALLAPAPPRVS